MKKLFLASKSPRRKEILTKSGIEFSLIVSNYEEKLTDKIFSYEKIETLAINKAKGALNNIIEDGYILSADTVVVLDNKILTKPKDYEDAFNILKALSNKEHIVVTSSCLLDSETKQYLTTSTTTKVQFNVLSDEMIKTYIETYQPYDKAGAYGIQEMPQNYINQVTGDLENVIGLSSKAVIELITQLEHLLLK